QLGQLADQIVGVHGEKVYAPQRVTYSKDAKLRLRRKLGPPTPGPGTRRDATARRIDRVRLPPAVGRARRRLDAPGRAAGPALPLRRETRAAQDQAQCRPQPG